MILEKKPFYFLIFASSERRPKCLTFHNLQFYGISCLNNLREKAIFIKQLPKEYIIYVLFQPYVLHVYCRDEQASDISGKSSLNSLFDEGSFLLADANQKRK